MSSAEPRTSGLSVTEAVRAKRAVRAYSGEPVPEELIRAVLNAGAPRAARMTNRGHLWW